MVETGVERKGSGRHSVARLVQLHSAQNHNEGVAETRPDGSQKKEKAGTTAGFFIPLQSGNCRIA